MAVASVKQRLTEVEKELAQTKLQIAKQKPPAAIPWWEQRFGAFADSPEYEQAVQAGRKYRESLRPTTDENSEMYLLDTDHESLL